jgi:hypothetical protein
VKPNRRATVDRRSFIRALSAGTGAVAASFATLPGSAAAAKSDPDKPKARYKETDHVKTFYRVNRYPEPRR